MSQSKQVIILVSDDNYIEHCSALAVACRKYGNYKGDFAVICPGGSKAQSYFWQHGFAILPVEADGFLQKFSIFHETFKNWDQALYLDADIIIQGDLQQLFDLLEPKDSADIYMDNEDGDTWRTIPVHNRKEEEHKELYDYVKTEYPHVFERTFNSAFILFKPEKIAPDTPQQLMAIQDKIELLNRIADGGTDQQVINLLLHKQCQPIPNKIVCYWGLDEPENRGPSEYRKFVGGEIPVAIHTGRHYAMWNLKGPTQACYYSDRLNRVNYDLYHENLRLFNEYFPKH